MPTEKKLNAQQVPEDVQKQIAALVDAAGIGAAAKQLGVSKPTIVRALARAPMQGTSVHYLTHRLRELAPEKTKAAVEDRRLLDVPRLQRETHEDYAP
jgi:peptide deformylase